MRTLLLVLLALSWASPGRATVLVRFATPLGDFDVELYDDVAPITVENFLRYVRDERYVDSFVHRSARIRPAAGQPVVPFVIQGGGFTYDPGLGGFVFGQGLRSISSYGQIQNEYELSNLRGTIAMAKVGGNANSATSQWFINLRDNGGLPAKLDTENGGFTVFGRVVEPGMTVVDAIADLTRWNATGVHPALGNLPLIDYVAAVPVGPEHIVYTSITEVPEAGALASRGGALATVLLLARLRARRRAAGRRP
jgi:cyclophilin family peptidyl-prolyl cis-trans isomerase